LLALVLLPGFDLSSASAADLWYVDRSAPPNGDGKSWETAFSTIHEGISAASDGDTVIVAEGTYYQNIRFYGKNIILRSRDPLDPDVVAGTIIGGTGFGSVVTFSGTEDHTCVLSGFTIRNGLADNAGGICGGTRESHTHATICHNVIADNQAIAEYPDGYGGGLAYCDGLIENNTITRNSARRGGGFHSCNGTIRNNVVVGNSAGQNGGGVLLCEGVIENNTIVRNFAEQGGGLYGCNGVIRNCIIWGNGGGGQLQNCSIPTYCCIGGWTEGGTGNISYYPYFVDATGGDYCLRSWSPCIDAGDPASPFSVEPSPNGGQVNMGAYGNTPEATPASVDSDHDGLPDGWELHYFANLSEEASGNPDGDDLSNIEEYHRGLDPTSSAVLWYVDASVSKSGDGTSWEAAFRLIQEGLDTAADGDTVIVSQGVYIENIEFNGKDIILQSTDPLDPAIVANTIIDGNLAGSVVAFDGIESESCILTGFTIRKGSAYYGGGIRGNGTRATIRNNTITDNSAEWFGGGLSGCDGTIENNTISKNDAFEGAGLAYCSGTVRNNIITSNRAGGSGGGLYGCSGTFEYNTVSLNSAPDGGGLAYCDGVFRRNTISNNSAEEDGGGLSGCSGTIENNVIWSNAAQGEGGGLFACSGTLQNNTILENSAAYGSGLSQCYGTILNSIIWGNDGSSQVHSSAPPTYCCIEGWGGGGEGNIDYNPYFVDWEGGDFHLRPRSPCIDAGDPTSPFSNEPEPNGGRVNLGAYGNTEEATSKSPDTDADGLPDDWETDWFGDLTQDADDDPDSDGIPNLTEYYYAWDPDEESERLVRNITQGRWHETIQGALTAAGDGDEIIVYPGHYVENIQFDGKNVILRSLDSEDPAIVADTIIDGNQSGPVVTFAGTENESCIIWGFTIRNGGGTYGGGILGGTPDSHTHATIQSNVICDNSGRGLRWCDGIIRDNIISRNVTGGLGGGLAYCNARVQNNIVEHNRAGHDGGGLSRCNGTIEDNIIRGNRAEGQGGGVASSWGVIQNNIIEANSAGGDAGALHDCEGTIQGNRIVRNSSTCGGALFGCDGTIRNNVISGNSAAWTGGILGCKGIIENNVIAGNSAVDAGGGLANCDGIIRNCIIWGNKAAEGSQVHNSADPTYSCIEGWTGAGEGNISHYPYFVDSQGGDYHLRSYSPCIDAGDPASDFSNEPQPNGGRINMGVYGDTSEAASASEDTDDDLLPDDWERHFFDDLAQGASDDADGDGIPNLREYRGGTEPAPVIVTWYVDRSVLVSGDGKSWETAFKRIQEGIDASSNGDTVVVAPGRYRDNIHFHGKNILLQSTDPLDPAVVESTIIDGGRLGSVVTFSGTEDESCILSGFTIQNGEAVLGAGVYGGGWNSRTHATIRNNVIVGNSAEHHGGGVAFCNGQIHHNIVRDNSADYYGGAGFYECHGTIENNIISRNSQGGLRRCDGAIQANIISDNSGCGLLYCNGVIRNNVISRNSGGGLAGCNGSIRNCIIWGNGEPGQLSTSASPAYSCIQRWTQGGEGNIVHFPYFVDPANGDYHLKSWSPCVDAGDPLSPYGNEPEPNGGRINMGAYGNTPEAASASADSDGDLLPDDWEMHFFGNLNYSASHDPDADGVSNLKEYRAGRNPAESFNIAWYVDSSVAASGDGRSWQTAFKRIQEGIDASSDEDAVIVAQGTYSENIHFDSKNIILQSTDPLDPAVVENTIIDGGQLGSVVTFSGTQDETSVLSGFSIRNGSADRGGGIAGNGTYATIRDNVITGNSSTNYGGGLYWCDGRIENNIVYGNSADYGRGLYWCGGPIQNNIVCGGLYRCDGPIQNNLIYGGGLARCGGTIQNNTIVGKLSECLGTIRNCIIWGNTATDDPRLQDSSIPTYSCIQSWAGGGEGNIAEDPRFVDGAGEDFRLQDDSPCIDAGANYYWFAWPQRDLEGNCRLAGERVDMGCYEYGASVDSDGDLASDTDEAEVRTDPLKDDTDGDGLRDGLETLRGSDPLAPTPPRVVHVPSDAPSIQECLCLAVSGDEIIVAPGTYYVNIQFCGVDVILRSSEPGKSDIVASTILDGAATGPVVWFSGHESSACVLAGFTIRNGRSSRGGGICGGTAVHRTQARIESNTITQNSALEAYSYGGGLAYCNGLIRNNLITENSAERYGGLAFCHGIIQNNIISRNSGRYSGGGLAVCHGVIKNNVIVENSAGGYGGGLYDCNGKIENNVISKNSGEGLCSCNGTIQANTISDNSGDGLRSCDGLIRNNVISRNSGGGLSSCDGMIENNTICANSATHAAGIFYCKGTIRNCILWGNTGSNGAFQISRSWPPAYSCIQDWSEGGRGNISAYPQFVDPDTGDYRLAPDSPCIDAGKNEDWMWQAVDLDGNPRIIHGISSFTVDMGAYEFGYPFRTLQVKLGGGNGVELIWNSQPGSTYVLWSCFDLLSGTWTEEAIIPSGGARISTWNDPDTTSIRKFYRIEITGNM